MKIVIHETHGGFGLSDAAVLRYCELKGMPCWVEERSFGNTFWLVPPEEYEQYRVDLEQNFYNLPIDQRKEVNRKYNENTVYARDIPRDDPTLIQVLEELGVTANGEFAKLRIVEIPEDVEWEIEEYDGLEWVAEKHRKWYGD